MWSIFLLFIQDSKLLRSYTTRHGFIGTEEFLPWGHSFFYLYTHMHYLHIVLINSWPNMVVTDCISYIMCKNRKDAVSNTQISKLFMGKIWFNCRMDFLWAWISCDIDISSIIVGFHLVDHIFMMWQHIIYELP